MMVKSGLEKILLEFLPFKTGPNIPIPSGGPDILVNFPFYAKVLNVMLSSTKEVGGEGEMNRVWGPP